MHRFSHIDTWVFDLDGTLYDAESAVFPRVKKRMTDFVAEVAQVPRDEADRLRAHWRQHHGTTLHGLMKEHRVDPHAFLRHTHDVDISDVAACAVTQDRLPRLPGRKIVFTNAPRHWADRLLQHLDIAGHFDNIFAIEDSDMVPKPSLAPYRAMLKNFGIDPKRACIFEDLQANLKTAAELGMTTVWCHGPHPPEDLPHVHHKTERLSHWLERTVRKNAHV